MRTPLMRLLVLTEDWRDPPTIEAGESYENSDWSLSNRFYLCAGDSVTFCWYFSTLGIVRKKRYLFKWPKITLSFFLLVSFSQVVSAPCRQEVWFFQLSVGVKASLVESQLSSSVFISFNQRYRFSKVDMLKPVVSTQMLAIFFIFHEPFCYRLPIVFGGLCRLPPPGFTNMYLYKLVIVSCYSYRFLGRQCIGSVEVQAKLKWNDRGYYTIPPVDTFYVFVSPCSKLNRTQMHKESS